MRSLMVGMLLAGLFVMPGCSDQGTTPNTPRTTPNTTNTPGTPGGPKAPGDAAKPVDLGPKSTGIP